MAEPAPTPTCSTAQGLLTHESPWPPRDLVALLAKVNTGLLRAEPENVPRAITESLGAIGAHYDLDYAETWWLGEHGNWVREHFWRPPHHVDGTTNWPTELTQEDIDWASERLVRGEPTHVVDAAELPPEAAKLRALQEAFGVVSHVLLPIRPHGVQIGTFCAGTIDRRRPFDDRELEELGILSETIAAAHSRAAAEVAVRRRERMLTRSQQLARIGSYVFWPKRESYVSSPELDSILGLSRDSERSPRAWAARVHPDDRERMSETTRRALASGSSFAGEYRYVRKDGDVRVVEDRAEILRDENGHAEEVFGTLMDVTDRRAMESELRDALDQLRALKVQLEAENRWLRAEVRDARDVENIIGESRAMQRCLRLVERVAGTDATVLIEGETGTGKELIARAIHHLADREGPLVTINCAALPAHLVESELFGHEKGAFTGATARKAGRLELADRGTLFLDEIGELPIELQSKLLRVLQDGEYQRVGGLDTLEFRGRVIAATNRDLEAATNEGSFRSDLYYRLNVFPIPVPPLRDRTGDIEQLTRHFVAKHDRALGREIDVIAPALIDHVTSRAWPGNVRELENFVQRVLIVGDGPELKLEDAVPLPSREQARDTTAGRTLLDVERSHILEVLEELDWVIEGRMGAAARLGLAPSTLRSRMKKLRVSRRRRTAGP